MWSKDDISQGDPLPMKRPEPILTADQARKIAEQYHAVGGDLYNRVTLKIMKEIADTARRGGRALFITKFFNEVDYADRLAIEQHLKLTGYEIEMFSDQRDQETSYKVVW